MRPGLAEVQLQIGEHRMAHLGVDTKDLKRAERDLQRSTSRMDKNLQGIISTAKKVGAALASAFIVKRMAGVIKETTLLAARFETLGVVMEVVGRNAGYSKAEMAGFTAELEKTGF